MDVECLPSKQKAELKHDNHEKKGEERKEDKRERGEERKQK
jgi:hypothetical protein